MMLFLWCWCFSQIAVLASLYLIIMLNWHWPTSNKLHFLRHCRNLVQIRYYKDAGTKMYKCLVGLKIITTDGWFFLIIGTKINMFSELGLEHLSSYLFFTRIILSLNKRDFIIEKQCRVKLWNTANVFNTPFPSIQLKWLTLFLIQVSQYIMIKWRDFQPMGKS